MSSGWPERVNEHCIGNLTAVSSTPYRHAVPIRFFYPLARPAAPGIGDCLVMEERHYRVNRSDICFLKYLMESYEGLAMVTTEDAAQGRIVVRIAPGCADTVDAIMDSLASELYFERLDCLPTARTEEVSTQSTPHDR